MDNIYGLLCFLFCFFFCFVLFPSPPRKCFRLNHVRKVRKRCSHSKFSSHALIPQFFDRNWPRLAVKQSTKDNWDFIIAKFCHSQLDMPEKKPKFTQICVLFVSIPPLTSLTEIRSGLASRESRFSCLIPQDFAFIILDHCLVFVIFVSFFFRAGNSPT